MPAIGCHGEYPAAQTPVPTATARASVTAPTPAATASHVARIHRTRPTPDARNISSRPAPSSPSLAPTSEATESPTSTKPMSTNASCRYPSGVVMSTSGIIVRKAIARSGADASMSIIPRTDAAITSP